MADHDQRFKNLVREFLPELVRLYFADRAGRLDLSQLAWLDQEVFADPPQGQRLLVDLAARAPVAEPVPPSRPGEVTAGHVIMHVEIESGDAVAGLRPRMHEYYELLRRKHRLPVWPVAVYLGVGLDGLGWDVFTESLWGEEVQRFRWQYVGLPGLDAEAYLQGDNPLGVALSALMRCPPARRGWLKAEALRRLIAGPENEYRKYLLCECVEAYLPLEGPALAEYEHLLLTPPYQEVKAMGTTWFERGMAEGEARGVAKGQREFVRLQLEACFRPLSEEENRALDALPPEQLKEIVRKLPRAKALEELGLTNGH